MDILQSNSYYRQARRGNRVTWEHIDLNFVCLSLQLLLWVWRKLFLEQHYKQFMSPFDSYDENEYTFLKLGTFRNSKGWYLSWHPVMWWFLWHGTQSLSSSFPLKVIIHKSRSEQFVWNRNWGLGWLAVLKKKIGPIMSNFLGRFFHVS